MIVNIIFFNYKKIKSYNLFITTPLYFLNLFFESNNALFVVGILVNIFIKSSLEIYLVFLKDYGVSFNTKNILL